MKARTPRKPLVEANLLDKAIAYFNPKLAQRRQHAREVLALSGGYTGARVDRAALANWRTSAGSPNTDIIGDLPMLRSRSRDQMRNAPIALGALNITASHSVGTGLSCNPAINAAILGLSDEAAEAWQLKTRARFEVWARSKACTLDRRQDFYQLQGLDYRSTKESGDSFVLTPLMERDGQRMLVLQLIEADRVCNPDRKADTETLVDGIELSPETGEAVAVHVAKHHPGDRLVKNTWERREVRGANTGRRNVLHSYKLLRPGQVRGVPWIAPILEPLKQLSQYTDAELKAAVDSAVTSFFTEMDPDAFAELYDESAQDKLIAEGQKWDGNVAGNNKVVNLLPGEEIKNLTPGRPNPQFDPFVLAILRQIGAALEIPFEVLIMHFQSSYTAARGAFMMAWKFFRMERDMVVTEKCQPVYELWLENEVSQGLISARGFFADPIVRAAWCGAVWTGDGPGSVDPGKDVAAAEKRVALGISTKQAESILHDGVDWETKHRQRVKETNAEKRDGIWAAPPGSPAPEQNAQPARTSSNGSDDDTETD
ncbi:phage portal protein [Hydrogenophaga taeniospiralis]|uniref:phage portal protein n=1 Tax=Hydrogenophaga taeniospiralis TaxID=65656 RepID=UPI001CFA11C5|nr:phage portal protein [Hydrogenophaga taeniospiralis]MCB4365411.1 phage portal protein [Hydrogenophaga taeniospiralis]